MSRNAPTDWMNWKTRYALTDADVLVESPRKDGTRPRVTIGLMTYKRPDTLRRALAAVARQTYRDFVLYVSDNSGVDPAVVAAVREFADALPEVHLVGQPKNLGLIGNMQFLLGCATTDYFMWLADDDEISANYLEELVALLDAKPDHVAAMGRWLKMTSPTAGTHAPQSHATSHSPWRRAFGYVAFGRDDTLIYGLHRTEVLRDAGFAGYTWPNSSILTNWCYVFLYNVVLRGPVAYSANADWVCHVYTDKLYETASALGARDRLRTLARRVNVHYLYCATTARVSPRLLPVVLPASGIGVAYDVVAFAGRVATRRLNR